MSLVETQARNYYAQSLPKDGHVAYLVYDNGSIIGAGGVSFYQVMPTYYNPSGKKAYLMNLYTEPDYRRRGIAWQTLDLLVKEAQNRGIDFITLETTKMGRPLYEKYGFILMQDEMILPKR
jgi:ribosomal protein S18 acetylase RimI-like enzyme